MTERAFYAFEGHSWHPLPFARGPWSNDHQHGGPPAALICRAFERFGPDAPEFLITRLTVDFLKPVPMVPLSLEVDSAPGVRSGRHVQRLQARLIADGVEVVRAAGLRIRKRVVPVARLSTAASNWPRPESVQRFEFPFFLADIAYHSAVDLRYVRGRWGDQEVCVWARPLVSTVAGESSSPLERLLSLVDAESGMCPPVPVSGFTFVNPDLHVIVDRHPVGDWAGLKIRSSAQDLGTGFAESALFDEAGRIGRSIQCLWVAERP